MTILYHQKSLEKYLVKKKRDVLAKPCVWIKQIYRNFLSSWVKEKICAKLLTPIEIDKENLTETTDQVMIASTTPT